MRGPFIIFFVLAMLCAGTIYIMPTGGGGQSSLFVGGQSSFFGCSSSKGIQILAAPRNSKHC